MNREEKHEKTDGKLRKLCKKLSVHVAPLNGWVNIIGLAISLSYLITWDVTGYYGQALLRYLHVRDTLSQDGNDTSTNLMLLAELKLWMADCLTRPNRALQRLEESLSQ